MNLSKLFETQKILRDRIGYNEPDRLDKLILALLVEIGECANEVRCFKFWSHKPASEKKVILEEFVDGLHFILELGIEIDVDIARLEKEVWKHRSITSHFNSVFVKVGWFQHQVWEDSKINQKYAFIGLLWDYISLSETLGFTWEEVEQAYFEKNKVNHQRQTEGY